MYCAPMSVMRIPLCVPLLAFLAAAALASPARAGGYVSAGLGGGASLEGSLARNFDSTDHDSGRISLGHRLGPVAVEASYFGAGMTGVNQFTSRDGWSTRTLGVDLKFHIGIIGPLETYLKLGLNKTWLDAPDSRDLEFSGRGWDVGAGLQYNFDLIAAGTAIWLDYTHQDTELRDAEVRDADRRRLDGSLGLLSLGVAVTF
jgi:hypothetical protein